MLFDLKVFAPGNARHSAPLAMYGVGLRGIVPHARAGAVKKYAKTPERQILFVLAVKSQLQGFGFPPETWSSTMRIRPGVVAVAAVSMLGAACGNPEATETDSAAISVQQDAL
jgi:hypothetical protein